MTKEAPASEAIVQLVTKSAAVKRTDAQTIDATGGN